MSTRSKSHHHHHHHHKRREPPPAPPHRRLSWCCTFSSLPPENSTTTTTISSSSSSVKKTEIPSKSAANSLPTSPQSKIGIVTRRILSPGRVSPIDEPTQNLTHFNHSTYTSPPPTIPPPPPALPKLPLPERQDSETLNRSNSTRSEGSFGIFDVRLNVKGKNGGGFFILELSSEVLIANSAVFADLIADYRKNLGGLCRIEVPDVDNLNVFRETIELMFEENEEDITKRLLKIGVYRTIDVLEVSAGIKFTRGVSSCLKYLEAMPWTEEEEEKLKTLFTKFKFDDSAVKDILARLYTLDSVDSQQTLARQLVCSITASVDANARNELKSLVKGLLCRSSIYVKEHADINKEDIFSVCESCLRSLVTLLQEAVGIDPCGTNVRKEKDRPLVERISQQVDNINWLLEILIDHQMAEDFVNMWIDQKVLLRMHEKASPMIRYELSRVSAMLFVAMGSRKLHCKSEERSRLLQAWFRPMLLDFGWLQRCRKGLDMKVLEEAMGQALLTLPLKEQYTLFMDWFQCFSKSGTECPNLSNAFQTWWRRSFLRGSETSAIESR